ncbi:hypothetical protein [Rubellimicrobium roseum]|nr:hypothetical protein [Rubellimicrobium roseum]
MSTVITIIDGVLGAEEWPAADLLHDSAPGDTPGYRLYGAAEPAASGDRFVLAIESELVPTAGAIGPGTTFWLDTDLNLDTGYKVFGAYGTEYNIDFSLGADGQLFAGLYTGAAGETLVAPLTFAVAPDGSVLEVELPASLLNGGPRAIRVFADVNNQTFLPDPYPGNFVVQPELPATGDPQVRIGIVYSETTAANYYNITNYGQLFMAAQNQAMQAGIPFDLLTEADLSDPANLAKYDALVFPGFSHVKASQADAIAASLAAAQNAYGLGLIVAGNFLTNSETGAALAGDSYARMKSLLGVTLEDFGQTQGIRLLANGETHPILDGYAQGQVVGQYTNASYLDFRDLTGAGRTLFDQVLTDATGGQITRDAVIANELRGRNVHFATDAILGNNNILGEAIDWAAGRTTPDVSLAMTRGSSIFYARNDMDQSQETFDVSVLEPGIYDAMLPIIEKWYQDWGFVGSYYINVGANPPDQTTDWAVSKPYYDRILALESEIGSHSYTHPEDTNLLLPDTPEILALVQRVDPRNPDAVDPWTLTPAEQDLLFKSYRFQFETSKLIIEARLGLDVVGAAVPGAPESIDTTREIIKYYDYLSGGYSGIGAGYPGAFGFVTPGETSQVYLAPNMSFDFSLIGFKRMTPEQATEYWLKEYESITKNGTAPIISFPWHDYGPTNWEDGNPDITYTLAMFETLIGRAAADGAEFVTGADLAARIRSFASSTLVTSRSGDVVTATVGSASSGHFALDMGKEGRIASVEGWYAYDDDSVFLPRSGGTFKVSLGPTPADVTHINHIGQRNELISVTGDGTALGFTLVGRSDVHIDMKGETDQRVSVTGADTARIATDGDLIVGFNAVGTKNVAVNVLASTGVLNGTAGNDILLGGSGSDQMNGLGGNDLLVGNGGNDALDGGAGDDRLDGNAGSDRLTGAGGADRLTGGAGVDELIGGLGDDVYVLSGSDSADDTITEIAGQGIDTVEVDADYTLGTYLDNLVLTGAANLRGIGNGFANRISGNDGDNVLDGLVGADIMNGGLGNDIYHVDNIGDRADEALNAGVDEIRTSRAALNISTNGMINVENLTYLGTAGFSGTGNALDNALTGGAGADTLTGGAGNDLLAGQDGADSLDGGTGDDRMEGGSGDDTYIVAQAGDQVVEDAAGGTDTVRSAISVELAANVENLVLTGGASLTGTGNALDNAITGNGGANTLDGGSGADVLAGLGGNDTYVVDNAADTVVEVAGAGVDTVRTLLAAFSLAGVANVDHLTFIGSGNFTGTGNALINTLTGGGGNDLLDGGLGRDRLIGGAGDDTYVIEIATEAIIEAVGAGRDTVVSSASYSLAANLEDLILVGAVNGTGNSLVNVLTGSDLSNTIRGSGGNDTLSGGGGDDNLDGQTGNDRVAGEAGNDILNAASGNDVFVFADGFGNDVVNSFDFNPTGGQDLLDLTAFDLSAATFGSQVQIADLGADILVTIGGDPGQTIRLVGAQLAGNITAQDFLL